MSRPLAAVPDLEHELDELYGVPLERFTGARNDLARRLKHAHQEEAAAAVKALRKPSVVAWTANQLARGEPELVEALLDAGERLRDVQQRALAGSASADEVNDAAAAERDAVRTLLTAARSVLAERATAALLDRLARTLRAAAVEPEARVLLERGRLTDELEAVGFGPLEAVKPRPRRARDELAAAARERVKELRAEARRLAREAGEAERAAQEASRAADDLAAEARDKRGEAERAATELAEAEQELRHRK
ncbi:MAG TPA: hypothetical protein VFA05_11360 [Gaiellaceae bacterium]|nr:hypothetical protein [Gaiellaceae bacterium]